MIKKNHFRLLNYLLPLLLVVMVLGMLQVNAAPTRTECENMTLSGSYAGKITSPFSGVALYANNDACYYTQYFANSTHKFSVRGCSNNSSTARVDLKIGGTTVGSFYFTGTTPTVQTLNNISHGTGNQEVRLTVTTDNNTWDAYVDYLEIDTSGSSTTPTPTPGGSTTKVMPLGDSITDGITVVGAYRTRLWTDIRNLGRTVDFVGSLSGGPAELGDKNHEGHSGWRIDQIDASINGWMDTYQPKIVLLHIGTNDVLQNYNLSTAPSRLSGLIDKICAKLPSGGKLYVAKIIPISNSGQNQNAINYNNQIPGIVQTKVSQGKPVYVVDMYSALTTADLADGVHPNQTGYNKMGDLWFNTISKDL